MGKEGRVWINGCGLIGVQLQYKVVASSVTICLLANVIAQLGAVVSTSLFPA